MGDVNLEIKLKNVKDKTDQIDVDNASNGQVLTYDNETKTFKPADGGSGTSYITSVSDDFIVDNGNLELSDEFKTSISGIEDTIEKAERDGFISRNIFNVLDYTIFQSSSQSKWNASNDGIRLTNNYFSTYGKYLLKLNPNDAYTFSYKVLVNNGAIYTEINDIDTSTNIFRKNDALNHEIVISGVTNIEIIFTGGASSTNALIYDIQLEKGSSASTYTPYALSNVELTEKVEPLTDKIFMTNGGTVDDLNIQTRTTNMWHRYSYLAGTAHAPQSSNAGLAIMYTNPDSANYGGMYAFSNGNIFARKLTGGTWGSWTAIFQ